MFYFNIVSVALFLTLAKNRRYVSTRRERLINNSVLRRKIDFL
jgi:hypothetical protein